MEQPAQVMPMTKEEFWKVYWFSPLQMVTLINPKPYDYKFMVEMRNFIIKAGAKEKMPGTVANIYLSQMTRIMAQDEDKMNFLSDFALMRQYFDKLIVDVENLVKDVDNTPTYLKDIPAHMRTTDAPEAPPWQQTPSSIPETNSQMKNTVGEQPPKTVEPSEKEFEFEGAKYKMTIDKNDKENFFRDGTRISAADYAKTASLL